MRFLTCREEAEEERNLRVESSMRVIHDGLESVRFMGRMVFHDGQWCGTYGTPEQGATK